MKIILVALNAKYVHSNLAVYDLEGYFKKHHSDDDVDIEVCEFTINHNMDYILQGLYKKKADVYAFSSYIWNIYEVISLVHELSKVLPNAQIWLGGPEASYGASKYLRQNPQIEGIMIGEGEETLSELGDVWVSLSENCSVKKQLSETQLSENQSYKKQLYESIKGIMFRNSAGEILSTPKRPPISMDDIPFIYGEIDYNNNEVLCNQNSINNEETSENTNRENYLNRFENKIIYYETSRGCPFSCSYCLSSIEKTVRLRSFYLVKAELDFFLENKVEQVKFVDRTFNCNREHARRIWKYILEHDNGITNFHFEIAADLIEKADIEIFKDMREGLIQLEIGLQSTNEKTVKEIRRQMDIDLVADTLLKIRKLGNIHQHLDLIAGLPYEDLNTFIKSFNEAMAMKPHQLQLGFLKVLKGSHMYDMADEYELRYRDNQPFEVLSTKWISYDEIMLLKRVEEMVEVYYNSAQYEHTLYYVMRFFDNSFAFYEKFGEFYEKNDLFGIGFKREKRYVAFIDFISEYFDESIEDFDMNVFMELLTFDYYLRENAKSRPQWLNDKGIYCKDKTKHREPISNKTYEVINEFEESEYGKSEKSQAEKFEEESLQSEHFKVKQVQSEHFKEGYSRLENFETEKLKDSLKKVGTSNQIISNQTTINNITSNQIISNQITVEFDYKDRNKFSNNARVTFL